MSRFRARRLLASAAAITMAATTSLIGFAVTATPASADGGFGCTVTNNRSSDIVNVRQSPSASASTPIVATLTFRDSAVSECHFHRHYLAGSRYRCFGNPEDNTWVRVYEDGQYGYVGWRCVTGP